MLLILTACTILSPEKAAEVRAALQPLVDSGQLTIPQVEALIASLSGGSFDWSVLEGLGWTALTIVGAILGINIQRGTPSNRKGLPPRAPAAS